MKAITLALLLTLMPQQVKNGSVSVIARDAITQQGISGVFVNLTYKFPQVRVERPRITGCASRPHDGSKPLSGTPSNAG